MHAKVVTIDVCGDGHGFEKANKELVDLLVVELLKYFGSESEMLCHGTRLMVAPEHDHLSRVVQLQAEQKHADFQRENSPVYVVAQEKEICPKNDNHRLREI